jgi:hypothetical protein
MPETSQLPPVSQPAREESRYPIGKVWIPHPSRARSVLLIRPDDELSLAWPFPRSAQGGWLCLTCGRVACSDDFPNQHAGACPHRRWCSVRQRTAQPTCWLQSAPTPESLQSAASTTRCPHYRRLAITDEASPFALRSTRNRPRRAMHRRRRAADQYRGRADRLPVADVGLQVVADHQRGLWSAAERVQWRGEELRQRLA